MKIEFADLSTCSTAEGIVVVIDVLRAFSTAAFAFGAGVSDIQLVGTVDEAFSLRERIPNIRLMGEVEGAPIPGFDFDNSPQPFLKPLPPGTRCVQRTTAGTQGVVRSVSATQIFAASFVCIGATVSALMRLSPDRVVFVITGRHSNREGDEDQACADYAAALLQDQPADPHVYLDRVRNSDWGREFGSSTKPFLEQADLDLCCEIDRFKFAMPIHREKGALVMRPLFESSEIESTERGELRPSESDF